MDVEATRRTVPPKSIRLGRWSSVSRRSSISHRTPYRRYRLWHRPDAGLDGRRKGHRTACAGVGQDRAQGRQPLQ